MQTRIQSCRFIFIIFKLRTVGLTALFCVVLLLVGVGSASAQNAPLTYQEYLALVGRIRGDVLNAQSQQGDNCNFQLEALANQLNNVTQILMPDGSVVAVDHAEAGLPFTFPYCNPVNFVSFLNGICPEDVCLTSGVVVAVEEERPFSPQTNIVDLIDFANSEPLPLDAPPDASANPNFDFAGGGSAESASNQAPPALAATAGDNSSAGAEAGASATAIDSPTGDDVVEGDEVGAGEAGAGETAVSDPVTSDTSGETAVLDEGGTPADATVGETAVLPTEQNTQPADSSPVDNGGEETAVVEPEASEPIVPIWLSIIVSLFFLLVVGVIIYFYLKNKQAPDLKPETIKKVEENVETGRQLLADGDYREAIHKLFNATLHILEDRGMLNFERSRTNYELLKGTSILPRLVTHLTPVVEAYDRVWYGFEPLAKGEFEALVDQIEQLKGIQRQ